MNTSVDPDPALGTGDARGLPSRRPARAAVTADLTGCPNTSDRARHPRRIQRVTGTPAPAEEIDGFMESAQELFTDEMNRFGPDPHL